MAEQAPGAIARALRLWHTLRWLRPVQVWGRVWFMLYRPRPDLRPAPPRRARVGEWQRCAREPSQLGPTRFRFLGSERDIAEAGGLQWDASAWPRLWRYNLHYFDDLVADGADARRAWHEDLVSRWIADNPVGEGSGWEPYPLSLRVVNWIKAGLPGSADHSLAVQARWLTGRLEIHLLGNHLWANAKALVFVGVYFEGDQAARWRERGLSILRRELREQILPDGGHFERSPMYHELFLEDLLDLLQLSKRYPGVIPASDTEAWGDTCGRMMRWLSVMTHPDGEIAFFNDATIGVAANFAKLSHYAAAVSGEACATRAAPLSDVEWLRDSGYIRLQAGAATLIADVAPVGPDYFPAHAHADTLSFELSIGHRRALVNSGISTYEAGPTRSAERGTASHNTVVVDDCDSSEVWGGFRVARRARPMEISVRKSDGELLLSASHDGYRRLPGRVTHRRTWRLSPISLEIQDQLTGTPKTAYAVYRVDPHSGLKLQSDQLRAELGSWHPSFEKNLPVTRYLVAFDESWTATTQITWDRPPL